MNILESQGCFLPSLVEINVEVVSGKEQFRRKSSTIQRPGFIFLSGKLILTFSSCKYATSTLVILL